MRNYCKIFIFLSPAFHLCLSWVSPHTTSVLYYFSYACGWILFLHLFSFPSFSCACLCSIWGRWHCSRQWPSAQPTEEVKLLTWGFSFPFNKCSVEYLWVKCTARGRGRKTNWKKLCLHIEGWAVVDGPTAGQSRLSPHPQFISFHYVDKSKHI